VNLPRLAIVGAASVALASCGLAPLAGIPSAPVEAADQTVLDEQAALAVELAYKAARLAIETGVDAGAIRGANATRLAELDNDAYAAVLAARRAYRAGNATGYGAALAEARAAISDMIELAS
jgi:hypothetical protein